MYINALIVTAGLLGLWFGSDLLIKSGKNIARHFGISDFFFGLVFVSIGTSIPEISVSIAGAIERLQGIETSGIVLGDKVGSAIVNITLFMGIFAYLTVLRLRQKNYSVQAMSLVGSVLFFFLLAYDGIISRLDAIIFLGVFFLYYLYLYHLEPDGKKEYRKPLEIVTDCVLAIVGVLFIILSSDAVVTHAVKLAELLGMNQTIVGLFLVGIGTGLPELSVLIMSARHKVMSLSMGDLLGSNVVDLLLATGLGGLVSSFLVDTRLLALDLPLLFLFTCIVLYFLRRNNTITRVRGSVLILLYLMYLVTVGV